MLESIHTEKARTKGKEPHRAWSGLHSGVPMYEAARAAGQEWEDALGVPESSKPYPELYTHRSTIKTKGLHSNDGILSRTKVKLTTGPPRSPYTRPVRRPQWNCGVRGVP